MQTIESYSMTNLETIAKLAGVHPATVSRILNGEENYKRPAYAKRARKIRELARQLGYKPNAAARAIAKKRFGAIALLQHVCRNRSYLPQCLLDGILNATEQAGYSLHIGRVDDQQLADEEFVPNLLRNWNWDGLLVNVAVEPGPRLHQLLTHHHVPAVWLNVKHDHDCVYPDDFRAASELTSRLLADGFRRLYYLGLGYHSPVQHYSKADRCAGYQKAMHEAGLEAIVFTPDSEKKLHDILDSTLTRDHSNGKKAAWIGYSKLEIEILLQRGVGQLGLNVPNEFCLATFGDDERLPPFCSYYMQAPRMELGQQGVKMLLKKISAASQMLPAKALRWQLRYRTGTP